MSKQWWWIGLTDESKPKGQQAIGAIVVFATDDRDAEGQAKSILRGMIGVPESILTFGEPMDPEHGPPPPHWEGRYLTKEQAEELAQRWCGGFASPDQIKQAFLDDGAKVGDPLFVAGVPTMKPWAKP